MDCFFLFEEQYEYDNIKVAPGFCMIKLYGFLSRYVCRRNYKKRGPMKRAPTLRNDLRARKDTGFPVRRGNQAFRWSF